MKNILLHIIKEIIPVMIGVYLGFALNNFGEEQKVKERTKVYTKMLYSEILTNQNEIKNVNEYHKQLKDDINKLLKAKSILRAFNNYKFRGLKPGKVNRSTYETGIQTGIIQEFELTTIQTLNNLYDIQNRYNKFNENMIFMFMTKEFPDTEMELKNLLKNFFMSMNDILGYENMLLEYYKILLAEIKIETPADI